MNGEVVVCGDAARSVLVGRSAVNTFGTGFLPSCCGSVAVLYRWSRDLPHFDWRGLRCRPYSKHRSGAFSISPWKRAVARPQYADNPVMGRRFGDNRKRSHSVDARRSRKLHCIDRRRATEVAIDRDGMSYWGQSTRRHVLVGDALSGVNLKDGRRGRHPLTFGVPSAWLRERGQTLRTDRG